MIGYIYMTTNNINNKKYIGRKCGKSNESYLGSGSSLKKAIKKYGKENFSKIVLEDNITDLQELYEKEIFYISKYNAVKSRDFYNLSPGGEDKVNNLDKSFLERVYRKRKGKKASFKTIEKLKESHKTQTNINLRKAVIQYDLDWNFIKEYESLSEATRQFGILAGSSSQLTIACRYELPIWGFNWKYKDKDFKASKLPKRRDTSKFRGVSFNRTLNKFQVKINYKKKRYYLGAFDTPEEAFIMYCKKAKELYGDDAKTQPYKIKKK